MKKRYFTGLPSGKTAKNKCCFLALDSILGLAMINTPIAENN